jgi:hypothetical protein
MLNVVSRMYVDKYLAANACMVVISGYGSCQGSGPCRTVDVSRNVEKQSTYPSQPGLDEKKILSLNQGDIY